MAKELSNVVLEDARLIFRNFSGKEDQYNRAGDRNFAVLLDEPMAEQLSELGWNVRFLKPRDDEDSPQAYLPVAVSYKARPPRVVMVTSRGRNQLSEEDLNLLDWADIRKADLIVNPYEWVVNGKTGVKAYLKSLFVTIEEDELDLKYADIPDSNSSNVVRYEED